MDTTVDTTAETVVETAVAEPAIAKRVQLVRATSFVMLAVLLSAALGLVREAVLAAKFGTSLETDAYFFAYDLVIGLPEYVLAGLAAGLIPVYQRSKKEGRSEAFASTVANAYILFQIVLTVLVLGTLHLLLPTLAAGMSPEGQRLVGQFVLVLSPMIVFAGIWGLLTTILEAEGHFFVATISRSFQAFGIIGAAFLLAPYLGARCLPIGILVAGVLQVVWAAAWLRRTGLVYRLGLNLKDPYFQRFLGLLGPSLAGGLVGYLIPVIDRMMAAGLSEGTIAAIAFASRPMALIHRIAVYSFIRALLPSLSWQAVHSDPQAFKALVVKVLGFVMFVTMPCGLLLAMLSRPVIQLLFERGRFDAGATALTAEILSGLAIGLAPMAIAVTLSTVFNSLEDTKSPAIFGAGSNLLSKIGLNILLIGPLGAAGLAVATSLKYVVSAILLAIVLGWKLQGLAGSVLLKAFAKITVASILAMLPVGLMSAYWPLPALAQIAMGTLVGATTYLLCAALLRIPELFQLYAYLGQLRNGQQIEHRLDE